MKKLLTSLVCLLAVCSGMCQSRAKNHVPLDSIVLSDPCILPDRATMTYYMTGTGGKLWKSKDLRYWDGPYTVAETDPASWMGPEPMIWAAELHPYKGKYYYFATFTNPDVKIGSFRGNEIERRACHVLVSDKAEGPYRPMEDKTYLPAEKPTLDGTLWVDTDGKPYMVYCYEWLQTWDGTIEKIELKPDLSGSMGEGQLLFRASDSPWSREVIDGDTVSLPFPHADRTVGHDMDQLDLRCLYPRSSLFGKRHIGRPVGAGRTAHHPAQLRPWHVVPHVRRPIAHVRPQPQGHQRTLPSRATPLQGGRFQRQDCREGRISVNLKLSFSQTKINLSRTENQSQPNDFSF